MSPDFLHCILQTAEFGANGELGDMEVRKAEPASPCRRRQFKYFLDLPGELRNKIYDFALFEPNGVYLDQPVLPELPWKRSINGSVLRVNRQIAAEATPRL
ncbi:hypothetical protein VTJ04DRAFT_3938 [Mycothermus thermophilus]|uniref:uncharacterized protein n=1 Tax=Humicola insolens TaxID=85995 RepID=UPI00374226E4